MNTDTTAGVAPTRAIAPGMILINGDGMIKIIRSRMADGTGWNCADGAGIDDASALDPTKWSLYTPDELVGDLKLAGELRDMSGNREFGGGLATWDACSGRPCVLPKLARVVNRVPDPVSPWLAAAE